MAPKKAIKSSPIKRSKPVYKTYTRSEVKSLYVAKKLSSKPKSLRKQLIQELDTVFSRYIRLKESVNGVGTCVTCLRKDNWRNMDCGHFISRGHFGTRFDEKNCHIQCQECNRLKKGNMKLYRIYMESLYGVEGVQELVNRSRQPLATYEIQEKIDYYKKMLLTFA